MTIPTTKQLKVPVVRLLEHEEMTQSQFCSRLAPLFPTMTKEEMEERYPSGQKKFYKRVWDAREQLKKAGIVDYADSDEPERPTRLTERGRKLLALSDVRLALVL